MFDPTYIGDNNWVRCGFRDCFYCCLNTEMLLTEEDVKRIETYTDYKRSEFLLPLEETRGFYQLRNVPSPIGRKCFFLTNKGKCSIYKFAPEGCKLYPLVMNLDTKEVMVDYECREYDWFREQTYKPEQVEHVFKLVKTLIDENEEFEIEN